MYVSHCFHHKIYADVSLNVVCVPFRKPTGWNGNLPALNGIKVKGGKNLKQLEFSSSGVSADSCCFSGRVFKHHLSAQHTHTHTHRA